jgi:hypothetical protein
VTLGTGILYYYGANNDIIEIKKIDKEKITYIKNKEEYTESITDVKSKIEIAGNRIVSKNTKLSKLQKINDKIQKHHNTNHTDFFVHKELLKKAIIILFGKRYDYKLVNNQPRIIHIDSGLEFEFDPLHLFSHATKEILPWFNVHNFLYHFEEEDNKIVLKIYNKLDDLQNIVIKEDTKNLCLVRGLVEADALYRQNIVYNMALLNNIAKKIYRSKKLEEKKDHILVVVDKYNEEFLEFNPLKNTNQAIDIVLNEIGKVFNFDICKKNQEYCLSIFTTEQEFVLEEKHKDMNKLICMVFESLLGY